MQNRLTIKPNGYVILDVSTALGGVTYDRTHGDEHPIGSDGSEREIHTVKTIDHKAMVKIGDSLVQAARYALRCHATNTTLGWFCDRDSLAALRDAFDKLAEQATEFNMNAAVAGSARRVRIRMIPVKIEIDNAEAAAEIAKTVRDVCTDLIDALRAGAVDRLAPVFLRAKNLEKLGTGMQRDSIVFAIENAKAARTALRQVGKDNGDVARAGSDLDLEALEACVGMFAEIPTLYADALELAS